MTTIICEISRVGFHKMSSQMRTVSYAGSPESAIGGVDPDN